MICGIGRPLIALEPVANSAVLPFVVVSCFWHSEILFLTLKSCQTSCLERIAFRLTTFSPHSTFKHFVNLVPLVLS